MDLAILGNSFRRSFPYDKAAALACVRVACGIPPWDTAMAESELNALVSVGILRVTPDGVFIRDNDAKPSNPADIKANARKVAPEPPRAEPDTLKNDRENMTAWMRSLLPGMLQGELRPVLEQVIRDTQRLNIVGNTSNTN